MSKQLQRLMDEVSEWQHKTFETVECVNISRHLEKEARELTEAIENDPIKGKYINLDIQHEMADCLILLSSCVKKYGFTAEELISFGFEKLEINKSRKWGKQNPDGTYTHIEQ